MCTKCLRLGKVRFTVDLSYLQKIKKFTTMKNRPTPLPVYHLRDEVLLVHLRPLLGVLQQAVLEGPHVQA